MAAQVRRIDQFHSLLPRDTWIYLLFVHALIVLQRPEPQLPPKLVHPFQEVETFDWNVSNKTHKNLVTRLDVSHLERYRTNVLLARLTKVRR
jgi:hypothetical protein